MSDRDLSSIASFLKYGPVAKNMSSCETCHGPPRCHGLLMAIILVKHYTGEKKKENLLNVLDTHHMVTVCKLSKDASIKCLKKAFALSASILITRLALSQPNEIGQVQVIREIIEYVKNTARDFARMKPELDVIKLGEDFHMEVFNTTIGLAKIEYPESTPRLSAAAQAEIYGRNKKWFRDHKLDR